MNTKTEKIENIKPYGDNPRENSAAVEPVAESIRAFGFLQPIVLDGSGVIIAGHTRYEAAKILGLKEVPVVYADLDAESAAAYRLADNKTAELSKWDPELLAEELGAIKSLNMEAFGFIDESIFQEPESVQEETPGELITLPFAFSLEDCDLVEESLKQAELPAETYGNMSTKGNKLTEVCTEWEAQRI